MTQVPRQSLAESVYDHLLTQLSLKKLKVGARINAREVTEELAVSRTTVNKALDRLVKAGWVKINERGRPIVSAHPPKDKQFRDPVFDFANQTDSSYEIVLERILRGDFQPGEVMKERPLANELGVNPATVRRAAEWLSKDGLLVRLPRRGWRVVMLGSRDIKDIYKVRLLLEPLMVEGAADRISVEALDQLEAETNRLIDAGENSTAYERRKADRQFHMALCEASGSQVFAETLDPLITRVLLITTVGFRYGRVSRSFEEHREILQALRKRDPDEAVKRLKNHLNTALKLNLETWERR
ncbi:MAG TPA: GntR family transcriptional regulator [Verrucomicrobiae bacterium]|jgi:DNA-binding GntR family transcriptional regulator|nr:GntR family transcriptional regulator [Verrucomicrobiae bacterium]